MKYTDEMILQMRQMKPSMLSKRQRAALVNYFLEPDAETVAYIKANKTDKIVWLSRLSTAMIMGKVSLDLNYLEQLVREIQAEMPGRREKNVGVYRVGFFAAIAAVCLVLVVLLGGW